MSDLTDDELRARLQHAMGEQALESFVEPLRELQRHRAARAADAERVRSVVEQVAIDVIKDGQREGHGNIAPEWIDGNILAARIAARVAEQLAAPSAMVSANYDDVWNAIYNELRSVAKAARLGVLDEQDRSLSSFAIRLATRLTTPAAEQPSTPVVQPAVNQFCGIVDCPGGSLHAHDPCDWSSDAPAPAGAPTVQLSAGVVVAPEPTYGVKRRTRAHLVALVGENGADNYISFETPNEPSTPVTLTTDECSQLLALRRESVLDEYPLAGRALDRMLGAAPQAGPVAAVVAGCWECPFSFDLDPDGDNVDPWTCTAIEDNDGQYRKLGPRQDADGEWTPPPDWCPLRKADRLLTLRLP